MNLLSHKNTKNYTTNLILHGELVLSFEFNERNNLKLCYKLQTWNIYSLCQKTTSSKNLKRHKRNKGFCHLWRAIRVHFYIFMEETSFCFKDLLYVDQNLETELKNLLWIKSNTHLNDPFLLIFIFLLWALRHMKRLIYLMY